MGAHNFIDLKGKRFGRLLVLERVNNDKNGQTNWKCICDCGKETIKIGSKIRSGDTPSCGCNRKLVNTKHGMWNTTEYISYYCMVQRCANKNQSRYKNYGGRGITICDSWLCSFENFFEDMGKKPTKLHSIERNDVNGNYEPSNCRWATMEEQSWNKTIQKTNKSGIIGVSWDNKNNKWRATIKHNEKQVNLGRFDNIVDAANARKKAENELRKASEQATT